MRISSPPGAANKRGGGAGGDDSGCAALEGTTAAGPTECRWFDCRGKYGRSATAAVLSARSFGPRGSASSPSAGMAASAGTLPGRLPSSGCRCQQDWRRGAAHPLRSATAVCPEGREPLAFAGATTAGLPVVFWASKCGLFGSCCARPPASMQATQKTSSKRPPKLTAAMACDRRAPVSAARTNCRRKGSLRRRRVRVHICPCGELVETCRSLSAIGCTGSCWPLRSQWCGGKREQWNSGPG